MTVMSMPALPDCGACGGPVSLVIDGDGTAVEECARCGIAQKPMPPKVDRAELRQQVAVVKGRRPLLCPSCLRRRCYACHASACECPHTWTEGRRGAQA